MEYYWDAYLHQLSEEDLHSKSLREILKGFYMFLEAEGVLLTSGKGLDKLEGLEDIIRLLKHKMDWASHRIDQLIFYIQNGEGISVELLESIKGRLKETLRGEE